MTITGICVSVEAIPLRTPFITALRRVEHVEFVRVTLTTKEGLRGVGEAPPTKAITGEDIDSITLTIQQLIAPSLLERSLSSMDEAQSLLHGSCEGNSSAKAAVDIALYDLFAKQNGKPLYAYLGGSLSTAVTDVTISLNTPQTMVQDAQQALYDGFDILKIKVGGRDEKDIERITSLHDAVPGATLLIDANQAWSETESLTIIYAIKDLDIALIEQPVAADQFEAIRRITASSPIPILADESAFTLEDAKRIITDKAADMINIKLMKCGGIYKALEIIQFCEANGIHCMMGSMLEGPVSIAAALHLAMAYPRTVRFLDLDSPLLYRALPDDAPLSFERNHLFVHAKSGITG